VYGLLGRVHALMGDDGKARPAARVRYQAACQAKAAAGPLSSQAAARPLPGRCQAAAGHPHARPLARHYLRLRSSNNLRLDHYYASPFPY